jgi:DNA-binding CsgD family transcriptional regulator
MLPEGQKLDALMTDALFDPTAMAAVLRDISNRTASLGAQIISTRPDLNIQNSQIEGEFNEHLLGLETEYWDINPSARAIPSMTALRSIRDHDVIEKDAIAKDTAYQELLIPCGMGHFTGVIVEKTPESVVALAVHRPIGDEAFSDDEASIIEHIAQRFVPLLQLGRMLEAREHQVAIAAHSQDALVAVVDDAGRLKDCSEAFSSLIVDGVVRQDIHGKLALRSPDHAFTRLSPDGKGKTFPVYGQEGNLAFAGRLIPVPTSGFSFWGPRHVLSLAPTSNRSSLNFELLRSIFGLTRAESDVACALASGLSLEEISRQRGTSVHTSRSMLKSLFQKTDCHRQTDLVRLLISLSH